MNISQVLVERAFMNQLQSYLYSYKSILIVFAFLGLVGLSGCDSDPDADIKDINLEIEVIRTDSLLWNCSKAFQEDDKLDYITAYEQFLQPERIFFYEWLGLERAIELSEESELRVDSLIARNLGPLLADSAFFVLLDTVRDVFPYNYPIEERILPVFKRFVKHFPDVQLPEFRTHVNGYVPEGDIRYVDQIVNTDHFFSLGLHYFMGADFYLYSPNVPQYYRKRLTNEFMEVQVAAEIADGMVAPVQTNGQPRLLDQMIQVGIKQYFIEQLLPHTPDSLRFNYTSTQMEWANIWEARIYKELIPHLYKSDFNLHRDYLSEKPYTTSLSLESAPRMGEFAGYKIVSAFMARNTDETLASLAARQDYEVIFKEARYKP